MRDQIILSAIKWLNTPYHHHARVLGAGIDCAQLLVAIAMDVGLLDEQGAAKVPNYPPEWHLHNREEHLLWYMEEVGCTKTEIALPGDILAFRFGRTCSHVGVLINSDQFIHACLKSGKVVINSLNGDWKERLAAVYSFPGVN